jgi:hypothetical protein
MIGTLRRPARWAARQRRSPATIWYSPRRARRGPHQDRLQNALLADRIGQLDQVFLAEGPARLVGIAAQQLDRRLVGSAETFARRLGRRGLHLTQKGGQTASQTPAPFGHTRLSHHDGLHLKLIRLRV